MKKYKAFLPFILWFIYAAVNFSKSYAQYIRQSGALEMSDRLTVGGIEPIYKLAGFVAFYDELFLLLLAFFIFLYLHRKDMK